MSTITKIKSGSNRNGLKHPVRKTRLSVPKKKAETPYDRIKYLLGSVTDLPPDLSTNPKYMDDFGK